MNLIPLLIGGTVLGVIALWWTCKPKQEHVGTYTGDCKKFPCNIKIIQDLTGCTAALAEDERYAAAHMQPENGKCPSGYDYHQAYGDLVATCVKKGSGYSYHTERITLA